MPKLFGLYYDNILRRRIVPKDWDCFAKGSAENMISTDCVYVSVLGCFEHKQSSSKVAATAAEPSATCDEPAVLLNLSFNARNKNANKAAPKDLGAIRAEKKKDAKSGGVEDYSGILTRRLVVAATREEVHAVLSEAYKNLGKALQAAAGGDKDAAEVVRRLNKLIRRANRKVRDLTKEEDIRRREKRAERQEIEQLEKQLERELKQKIAERKRRERQYLKDARPKDKNANDSLKHLSGTISDARIKLIARQLAHSAVSTGTAQTGISSEVSLSAGETASAEED